MQHTYLSSLLRVNVNTGTLSGYFIPAQAPTTHFYFDKNWVRISFTLL